MGEAYTNVRCFRTFTNADDMMDLATALEKTGKLDAFSPWVASKYLGSNSAMDFAFWLFRPQIGVEPHFGKLVADFLIEQGRS